MSVRPQRSSQGIPNPTLPANDATPYPAEAWEEEAFALFAEGRDPGACPSCDRIGFYGPRVTPDSLRLRSCRFCGFHQEIGEPPGRAHPTAHQCASWPEIARAPYIWWAAPDDEGYDCPFCDERVSVAEHLVTAPIDDKTHPWWKVPQARTRFYYSRFWENWPYTKGRVFL